MLWRSLRAVTPCCEAVADLRILDAASQRVQADWLGGDADHSPGRWAAASPVEHARQIRTPTLLIYAGDGDLAAQGRAWHTALTSVRVDHNLISVEGADHVFSTSQAQRRLRREVTEWFERAKPFPPGDSSHVPGPRGRSPVTPSGTPRRR